MKVTVLASNNPDFSHAGANELVLGALVEGLALAGHEVRWATAGAPLPVAEASRSRLDSLGISFAGDFTECLDFGIPGSILAKRLGLLRQALVSGAGDDKPQFRDPEQVVSRLARTDMDVFLLFWDTWFEHLVPHMSGLQVGGYLAKPRYDAPQVRLKHGLVSSRMSNPLRRWVAHRTVAHQRTRHLQRMRRLDFMTDICAVDVANYQAEGLRTTYIPLSVPDFFSESWNSRRDSPAGAETGIIGAMGSMNALGSAIGVTYLAQEIVPRLERQLGEQAWRVNLYGRGGLPQSAEALLRSPRVSAHGYVEDIDAEMLKHPTFVFCNNAGPYTGTYTRVPYALSSGICLVAHSNLAKSVPELVHDENVLLGSSGEEIAALVAESLASPHLRRRIGKAGRETYLASFSPKAVGERLGRVLAGSGAPA